MYNSANDRRDLSIPTTNPVQPKRRPFTQEGCNGLRIACSSDCTAATHARHRGQRPSEEWRVELGLVEAALSRASADAAWAGEPPSQLYELFFRENIMNRIGFYATVVAALSVISFPVGALMLNSAASGSASSASSSESAGASAPALSPDGKPVRVKPRRVLSWRLTRGPRQRAETSPPESNSRAPPPAERSSTARLETQTAAAIHRALPVHSAPKRKAAAPQSMRSASAPAKKAFVISGLF
jgi:hypothetical protein